LERFEIQYATLSGLSQGCLPYFINQKRVFEIDKIQM